MVPDDRVRITVDGVEDLARALRAVGGQPLQRELGEVHRGIGQTIIDHAGGRRTGVGTGRGATIRPSAAARAVTLRVGGSHRDSRREQWGRTQKWPGGDPPERPHLIGAVVEVEDQIIDAYAEGIDRILQQRLPHFLE